MKIRAPKEVIEQILKAIQEEQFSHQFREEHNIKYELNAPETYISFLAKDGKSARLSKQDWNLLSSYVID